MPTSKKTIKTESKKDAGKGSGANAAAGTMAGTNARSASRSHAFVPAIVSDGHPALRQVSEEVPLSEIKSLKIQHLIEDMKLALASQDDGIGLAAPQIGVPLRIFLVSKKVFGGAPVKSGSESADKSAGRDSSKKAGEDMANASASMQDLVFINPQITKFSKEKKWMEGEGCLSVRWVYGKVQRSTKVTIRAYDEFGRAFERGAGGLLAHIFQHEVDHLNGILFIDKARDLEKVEQSERKAPKRKAPESEKANAGGTKAKIKKA